MVPTSRTGVKISFGIIGPEMLMEEEFVKERKRAAG